MDLKFKLLNGEIYEFKDYKGYSEFIDNLEPEPDSIIDVLESFTIEDFEKAYLEYNKYFIRKRIIGDIESNYKLWIKDDIIEYFNYDVNNPVFKWLMIKETKEEKDIRETLSLKSFKFNVKDINSDNIILYYFIDEETKYKFYITCKKGHLNAAQWLYKYGKIEILYDLNMCFITTCKYGHIEMAKWIHSLEKKYISTGGNRPFIEACMNNHLETAKWLFSLGGNPSWGKGLVFHIVCSRGHSEMAKWLYSLGIVDINDRWCQGFKWACESGHLEVVQWYYSLKEFRKYELDYVFTTNYEIQDFLSRKNIPYITNLNNLNRY